MKPGKIYERDGKQRKIVKITEGAFATSPHVTWCRPGDDWHDYTCSYQAWFNWVRLAVEVKNG